MQRLKIFSAIAAGAVLATGAAAAETAAGPVRATAWRCEGSACAAKDAGEAALVAQCRKVARAIGPLASYVSAGQALSPAALRQCNQVVRPFETARN